jgi:hypothetical protein
MIDQQMMQAGRILLSLLEPLPDTQDEILRQAGAYQENLGMRCIIKIQGDYVIT